MGRKIVPLRPARKEGSPEGTQKILTLADIAITWTEGTGKGETRHHVAGETLARLVQYLRYRHPNATGHAPFGGDVGLVPTQLRGLSYVVFPDAGAPSEDLETDARFAVAEYLEDLAARLNAEHAEANKFQVHVGPIPEEWTT